MCRALCDNGSKTEESCKAGHCMEIFFVDLGRIGLFVDGKDDGRNEDLCNN